MQANKPMQRTPGASLVGAADTPIRNAESTRTKSLCYLCGRDIEEDGDRDHVPPKILYGREIRRQSPGIQLRTLPTHSSCNRNFREDEEYFVYSIAPLTESWAGNAVLEDIGTRLHVEGRNRALAQMTLEEFEPRPRGLFLPGNSVAKRVDEHRIERVIWKIVRGLHFRETNVVLPSDHPYRLESYGLLDRPPDRYKHLLSTPSLGDYPPVFDYKRAVNGEAKKPLDVWGLLFWDSYMTFVFFDSLGP